MSLCAVTVTYGARWPLLKAALSAARHQDIAMAIVVDNGSSEPIAGLAVEVFGDWVHVHRLERNLGSAKGFKVGIELALANGATSLLLLDDDNVLRPDAVNNLRHALAAMDGLTGPKAVFAARADHSQDGEAEDLTSLKGSFCHFRVRDVFKKIARRLKPKAVPAQSPAQPVAAVSFVPTVTAPYGGLLFDAALIGAIGLPDERFVLYQDDSDFTYRIHQRGGHLRRVSNAQIDDAERSWNAGDIGHSSLKAWVTGADFRVYYAFRNHVYWDVHGRGERSIEFGVNLAVYMALLLAMCLQKGRLLRFGMLLGAMRDGIMGRLGNHADYPLPA